MPPISPGKTIILSWRFKLYSLGYWCLLVSISLMDQWYAMLHTQHVNCSVPSKPFHHSQLVCIYGSSQVHLDGRQIMSTNGHCITRPSRSPNPVSMPREGLHSTATGPERPNGALAKLTSPAILSNQQLGHAIRMDETWRLWTALELTFKINWPMGWCRSRCFS
jgi:hypothetical protein